MEQQSGGKISWVEAIFMLLITAAADLWEALTDVLVPIPVIGWILPIVNIFVSLFVWLIIQFWLIMKGVPGGWFAAGGIVDIVPVVNALPCKTAAMVRIIIQHSELVEDVLKIAEKIPLPQAKAAQAALKAAKTAGKVAGKA